MAARGRRVVAGAVALALAAALAGTVAAREGGSSAPVIADAAALAQARERAEAGDHAAMLSLVRYWWSGAGGTRDEARALEWLRRAAGSGSVDAQLMLGGFHLARGDARPATRWLCEAADAGSAQAMLSLSAAYEDGIGEVPRDRARALAWAMRSDATRASGAAQGLIAHLRARLSDAQEREAEALLARDGAPCGL